MLRRFEEQEMDPERRRKLSGKVWGYEKTLRKQHDMYQDTMAMKWGSLGRYGRTRQDKERDSANTP